ncbi:alpha/beta hydrolase fold protein [Xylaria bambusicola]|uniref:alpha/beta hydrolase fold protein n=1 Tax=Xylaria bambusicola TaxID=326684 RepID=UPI0020074326|nr:alpha/beta hydrolase fold protein [Xylaria bambusicola]KAI0508369.1 alpha/beta hydrolase fold protein [Xylaria bambusicola]
MDENSPNRYRLDTDSSSKLTLPDGRTLGYAQYGLLTGPAIFFLHGLPGSRLEGALFDAPAITPRARIISVDRPGYGLSSPQPNRAILDHVKDIEYLAQHLGLDSYGCLGISGGGPYALACAKALPADKLKAVCIICGLGPPEVGKKGMGWWHWAGFTFGFAYFQWACRWWFSRETFGRLDLTDQERFDRFQREWSKAKSTAHPKDAAAMEDPDLIRFLVRNHREAYNQGFYGFSLDGKLESYNFGFQIQDIRHDLPIHLWYGKYDTFVPSSQGVNIAARLGPNARLKIEDETHGSLTWNCRVRALDDLIAAMK